MSRLEPDVQPLSFASEHHRLRVGVLKTANWLTDHIKVFLDPHNLTPQQFNVLRILRGHQRRGGEAVLSTSCLRERMIDRASDTSRLVDRLARRGLVSKGACCADRRRVDVRLTEAGLQLLAEIDGRMGELDAATGTLSDEEAARLSDLLLKLRAPSEADV